MAFDGFQTGSVTLFGEWAHEETELILSLIKPGDTVLDIGANVGAMTLAFAAAVGETGTVLAFEPQLYPCECLRANIIQNSLRHFVTPYRLALGESIGEIPVPVLDPRTNNFGGCCLTDPSQHTAPTEQVPMVTIDSLGLLKCNLIKADVEGMEGAILRGASQTIAKFQPYIWAEQLDHQEGSREQLLKVFAEHDYAAVKISTPIYSPNNIRLCKKNPFQQEDGMMVDTNVFAMPRNLPMPQWPKHGWIGVEPFE